MNLHIKRLNPIPFDSTNIRHASRIIQECNVSHIRILISLTKCYTIVQKTLHSLMRTIPNFAFSIYFVLHFSCSVCYSLSQIHFEISPIWKKQKQKFYYFGKWRHYKFSKWTGRIRKVFCKCISCWSSL